MIYYHVLLGPKHIDLIQAVSAEHATQIVEERFGSSVYYSSEYNYRAVRA
jgi:hypothetical protein